MERLKDKSYRVYLSPANHYKKYAIDGYTEKEQMDKLAGKLAIELEKYEGVETVLTDIYDVDRSYTGRPEDARRRNCDIYVALHSNGGCGKGACVFYHPDYPLSKALALSIVKALNAVCPIISNRAVQPAIYAWNRKELNFGELRVPACYGIAPVLIEHEFHDTVDGARWLIENLDTIAKADAAAIATALGLKRKLVCGDVNGDGAVNSLDAAAILRFDAGLQQLTEDEKNAADINGDGKVNSLDAAQILKHDARL